MKNVENARKKFSFGPLPPRKDRGFTVIEVVVSLAIFSIAMMGTAGLVMATQSCNRSQDESAKAYAACQMIMEELLSMHWVDVKAQGGVTFRYQPLHKDEMIGTIDISSPNGSPWEYLEMTVRIQSTKVTVRPIDVQLTSRRSR